MSRKKKLKGKIIFKDGCFKIESSKIKNLFVKNTETLTKNDVGREVEYTYEKKYLGRDYGGEVTADLAIISDKDLKYKKYIKYDGYNRPFDIYILDDFVRIFNKNLIAEISLAEFNSIVSVLKNIEN